MITKVAYNFFFRSIQKIDWKLLMFLVLFINVQLSIKLFAVILIYALRFDFAFGLRSNHSRLPWFYFMVTAIALLDLGIYGLYANLPYDLAFMVGIFFWALCMLTIHQIKLSVEICNDQKLHYTVIVFFMINSIISLGNLLQIMIETGALNPYQYQGLFQKYFIGTGDNIRGVSFDTSTTNAFINTLGVVYFLQKKEMAMVLLCMAILLLTGSNLTNLLTLIMFIYLFIFKSGREQKSIIVICICMLMIFMGKVSPQNHQYSEALISHFFLPDNRMPGPELSNLVLTPEEQRRKLAQSYLDSEYYILQEQNKLSGIINNHATIKPFVPEPSIHSPAYQNRNDTTQFQKELINFATQRNISFSALTVKSEKNKTPGKLISMQETWMFFLRHPWKIFTGNGMGNFSSKLALRTTGLNIAGAYPRKYSYIDNDFAENHLAVFLYYFTRQKELHSVVNTPDSVYNQLAGEYGLAGIMAFFFFYIGFFVKKMNGISDAFPYLFILLAACAVGYWFEHLSLVPLFELLIFKTIKEKEQPSVK